MKNLLEEYEKIPYIEKRVLQLKFLSRKNISQTDFLQIVDASDVKFLLGRKVHHSSIKPILDNLIYKKLLKKDLSCNPAILPYLTLEALSGKYREQNIKSFAEESLADIDKIRLGIYFNDAVLFKQGISGFTLNNKEEEIIKELKERFYHTPLTGEWWDNLLPYLQGYLIAFKLYCVLNKMPIVKQDITVIESISEERLVSYDLDTAYVNELFFKFFLLKGEINTLKIIASNMSANASKCYAMLGIIAFLQDDQEQALANFNNASRVLMQENKKRNLGLSGMYGIFHILALLKESNKDNSEGIKQLLQYYNTNKVKYLKEVKRSWYNNRIEVRKYFTIEHEIPYSLLAILVKFMSLDVTQIEGEINNILVVNNSTNIFDELIAILVLYWTGSKVEELKEHCDKLYTVYKDILPGLGYIMLSIRNRFSTSQLEGSVGCNNLYKIDFLEIVKIKPEWERAINSLESLFTKQENKTTQEKRLAWLLYPERSYDKIEPIEQKRQENGSWSRGRSIALKRLYQGDGTLNYLTENDRKVLKSIKPNYYGYGSSYIIETREALLELAGHPLIFDGNTGECIELTRSIPELIVQREQEDYRIMLSDYNWAGELKKEGENKYQILDMPYTALEIEKIIGKGIKVPQTAKDKILSLMRRAVPNINIRTELQLPELETQLANCDIVVQLVPLDDGIKVNLLVKPFGSTYYTPGAGSQCIIAFIEGNSKQVARNLAQEKKNVQELLNSCTILSQQGGVNYEWRIIGLEAALEVLYELGRYKEQGHITIEWPQGQSLYVDRQVSFEDLRLRIKGSNQWFDITGEVEVDEEKVIDIQSFLQMLDKKKGRFVEVSDKKFIALTDSFLRRVQELNTALKLESGGQRLHRLASPLISEFIDKAKSFDGDEYWKQHIEKVANSQKYDPKVPNGLQAELRPYQVEGFQWLSRLNYLGSGACLADDMGLGKTVQTIAILLEQAASGPCLVVAPASVCYVWEEECRKFAPTLNCSNVSSGNREEQISTLGNMDVLICSYGMLNQIGELLGNKQWQVVVLDEAQAIKNFNTRRFKIVTQLRAINRIALTGTPVENHTEELWNLFEFLNPGMLGTRESFKTKYSIAIEQDKNIAARNALKKMIHPFILRRMKSEVLAELPLKTEQTILIEPSEQEVNFYEALRRESVEKLKRLEHMSSAKQRFGILAEITKLRRACCDSSLIDSNIELVNSKLEMLERIIAELRENKHRALIFSQYVDYLKIIKNRLDRDNISYQYIDGSVIKHHRQTRVEAFQSGEGELFLISLKAGGVGLNLTAADYVIHLDPWWNPAIEDQASDRAYRIGQKRPVTIYRLVMKGTIEEKIIKMHQDKRELALSLLSDSSKSASLSTDELLQLLLR